MPTATCKRVYLPKLGHFAHFHDRHAMKRGHPQRSFSHSGRLADADVADRLREVARLPDVRQRPARRLHVRRRRPTPTTPSPATPASNRRSTNRRWNATTNGSAAATTASTRARLIDGWKAGIAGVAAASILDALDIDTTDPATMRAAIYLFGGVLFMLDVPDPWCKTADGDFWDVPARADRNNGHGTWINGVDAAGNYHLLTWGGYRKLTPAGLKACDPSGFVVFSLRWFNASGYAPNGLHYAQLAAMWTAAGGQAVAGVALSFAARADADSAPGAGRLDGGRGVPEMAAVAAQPAEPFARRSSRCLPAAAFRRAASCRG